MLAIEYSTEQGNNRVTKQHKNKKIYQTKFSYKKTKTRPNLKQIEIWQQQIEDIENYKIQSTIIRSKEKFIINQEKPNEYFYQQEKQKQLKKQIKLLTTDQTKSYKQISKY